MGIPMSLFVNQIESPAELAPHGISDFRANLLTRKRTPENLDGETLDSSRPVILITKLLVMPS